MRARAVVATALLAAAGRAEAGCQIGIMANLPVTMQGLRPTTMATINGTEAPFLVDSGAFFSVITPGSARQYGLHLDPAPPGFYMRGIGGDATVSVATVQQFGFAGQSLRRVQFLVGGSEVGQDSGGVIGYNVLGIGDAEYDLARGVVRLIRPTGCVRADFPYWARGTGSEVATEPGIGTRPNRIVASAFVNGMRVRVLFDTGAATSAISRAAATRAGIDLAGPGAVESGVARGFGRRVVREWTVPVAVFKIGDEEIHKTRINVIDELGGGVDAPDMLLGADFFLSHRVYIARDLHKLYFTYNGGNVFNLRAPVAAAAADIGAAAKDEPVTAEDFAHRGTAFAARQDYARAVDDLTRAISLAPAEPRYLAERAAAYAGNRQPFLAMADLDAALKLRPDDVPTLMRRAVARLGGRDGAGALADLAAADAAAPREADVRLGIGQLYARLGDLPRAVAQYDLWMPVHRDDSKQATALNARCWARALLGTGLDLAEKDCTAAHRLEPGNLAFLDSRGLVRLRRGDLAGAIADYDVVLAKEPALAWSLYGRGIAKARLGRADAAADLAAARTAAPRLAAFARIHGITAPGDAAPAAPATGPAASAPAESMDDTPPAALRIMSAEASVW